MVSNVDLGNLQRTLIVENCENTHRPLRLEVGSDLIGVLAPERTNASFTKTNPPKSQRNNNVLSLALKYRNLLTFGMLNVLPFPEISFHIKFFDILAIKDVEFDDCSQLLCKFISLNGDLFA